MPVAPVAINDDARRDAEKRGERVSSPDYRRGYEDGRNDAERDFQVVMSHASLAIYPKARPYKCRVCGKSFLTGKQLGGHVSTFHPRKPRKARRARCKICGQIFKNAITVRHHMDKDHPDRRRS